MKVINKSNIINTSLLSLDGSYFSSVSPQYSFLGLFGTDIPLTAS